MKACSKICSKIPEWKIQTTTQTTETSYEVPICFTWAVLDLYIIFPLSNHALPDMYELDYDEEPIVDQPVRISSTVSFGTKDFLSFISNGGSVKYSSDKYK
ncbi:hypothetical protein Y032_0312g2170 [Ancylostoma ceylanicum]|uniref:Uncharacterized protein n=1 Tax=Ancylostoma ceylanicum TaxID=53326 RepID=A0A016S1Y4_9BILA|nr:hypothetical protein Y032_0312g2170 [Ancylostoma ceylanicum]